jgi:hypothetical protein
MLIHIFNPFVYISQRILGLLSIFLPTDPFIIKHTHHPPPNMPTFLIVGATGKQGGKAISTLLDHQAKDKDVSLRFITRNPGSASAKKLVDQGAEAFKADLLDRQSLRQALTGVDRAFLVTDAMAGEEKEAEQGQTFIDVAQEVGVKHIVFTSVSAADTAVSVPHFRSKHQVSILSRCLPDADIIGRETPRRLRTHLHHSEASRVHGRQTSHEYRVTQLMC